MTRMKRFNVKTAFVALALLMFAWYRLAVFRLDGGEVEMSTAAAASAGLTPIKLGEENFFELARRIGTD